MENRATKRYTEALFKLAEETGQLDEVSADLQAIHRLVGTSDAFRRFLRHPLIPSARRRAVLKELLDGKCNAMTVSFLLLLEEKGRMGLTTEICRRFELRYGEFKGVRTATVTSAHPLSEKQLEALQARLTDRFATRFEVETRTDPSLVGGFLIKMDDRVVDASVATMLESFKQKLLHA